MNSDYSNPFIQICSDLLHNCLRYILLGTGKIIKFSKKCSPPSKNSLPEKDANAWDGKAIWHYMARLEILQKSKERGIIFILEGFRKALKIWGVCIGTAFLV